MKRIAVILAVGGPLVGLTGLLFPQIAEHLQSTNLSSIAISATAASSSKCQAEKLKASAKKVASLLKCEAKAASSGVDVSACTSKAESQFLAAFTKAETKALQAGGRCATEADAPTVEGSIDTFVADVRVALHPLSTPSSCSAKKLTATASLTSRLLLLYARARTASSEPSFVQPSSKATTALISKFAKADASGFCQTTGDADAIRIRIGVLSSELVKFLWPITDSGVTVTVPPGSQFNPAPLALGGPLHFDNFNSQYLGGGAIPGGGMEIDVARVPLPSSVSDLIASELQDEEIDSTSLIDVDGSSATRIQYTNPIDDAPRYRNVVVYVTRNLLLYKIFLTFNYGDPNETQFLSDFDEMLTSLRFAQ